VGVAGRPVILTGWRVTNISVQYFRPVCDISPRPRRRSISSTYRATGSAHSTDRLLLRLVRRSETSFRPISQRLTAATSGVYRRRFCLRGIGTFSALGMYRRATQIDTFTFTLQCTTTDRHDGVQSVMAAPEGRAPRRHR